MQEIIMTTRAGPITHMKLAVTGCFFGFFFAATVKSAQACDVAMLVAKGIDSFPKSKAEQMEGSVDVWCIVHDGGLLLLTSYLLMRNRVWRKCDLRVFVVASEGDDTVNLKKDMTKFMYDLRINATVDVVAMSE
ncbi:hypothetical protein X801_03888 [Opisthorchis viverrini]|uniref:SLC12A transporter C-terminal domain-containing protein n=1 Tax=Opisthorchis viverrini TaxID=6198 RepID=A0A1S8X0J7_OPIVI|nr:hypothetical protein X801_03888 [Opisthorchis viverrini]